ncbi:hypothetical protein FOZ60_016947 [Perkinsus olseni]|uniref:Uncharacterized protein n=1 Tax=Perkinsus olseni TaxID=32597 RepID=A0A7J6P3P6_PEROL|nr:hypothetical protein FOZ60_016947 [Perkinsus olseni]
MDAWEEIWDNLEAFITQLVTKVLRRARRELQADVTSDVTATVASDVNGPTEWDTDLSKSYNAAVVIQRLVRSRRSSMLQVAGIQTNEHVDNSATHLLGPGRSTRLPPSVIRVTRQRRVGYNPRCMSRGVSPKMDSRRFIIYPLVSSSGEIFQVIGALYYQRILGLLDDHRPSLDPTRWAAHVSITHANECLRRSSCWKGSLTTAPLELLWSSYTNMRRRVAKSLSTERR